MIIRLLSEPKIEGPDVVRDFREGFLGKITLKIVCWTSVILVFGWLRQEDFEFKANLD
jgi:hypothetical protein